MASVELSGVHKSYGAVQVLRDIDIQIEDGEFVVLVGPSGCGKSTLLRMVAGLEPISGGTVAIGDRMVNGLAAKKRDIAMVFQNYALYPHMTIAENMGFSLALRHVDKKTRRAAVERAAGILGLSELLDRYPKQLSGGQRQRVAMGRAIVRDPKVFLFDEPLSNLDANLRVAMRAEVKELHHRLGTTMIYVTHDQVEAMTMADRIVVLRGGIVEQVGPPLDLYDNPANLFVGQFIGSPPMNIIEGEIRGGRFAGAGFDLSLPAHLSASAAGPAKLGVRPEFLGLVESGGVEAEVLVVEPTGSETMVVCRVGGQNVNCLFRERIAERPGARIRISANPEKVFLFDAETGARLA